MFLHRGSNGWAFVKFLQGKKIRRSDWDDGDYAWLKRPGYFECPAGMDLLRQFILCNGHKWELISND